MRSLMLTLTLTLACVGCIQQHRPDKPIAPTPEIHVIIPWMCIATTKKDIECSMDSTGRLRVCNFDRLHACEQLKSGGTK